MSLLLYHFPHSTCSQKVRLVLWEKGLDFEAQAIDHKKREQTSEWYLKMNPNGVVPTLKHDDDIIVDSSVIIEYLDEVFPEHSLTPSDPVKRAKMRKWMRYFEEVPTPAIRVPSFNKYLAKNLEKFSDEEFEQVADKHPMRKHFYHKMTKGEGFDDQMTDDAIDQLRITIDRMEKGLEESGGPWLMGEDLTLADYTVLPAIDRMDDLGLSFVWDHAPRFKKWFEDIKARPAFAKTYHEKTRLSELFDQHA
jgi:glutathione S-transferase